MSSWVLPLLLLAPPPGEVDAEQAMETYRQTFNAVPKTRCTVPERPDELIVCARRPDADRLPLPVEPEPGTPVRLVPGESPRGSVPRCVFACHTGFVGINLKQAKDAVDAVKRVLEGDD